MFAIILLLLTSVFLHKTDQAEMLRGNEVTIHSNDELGGELRIIGVSLKHANDFAGVWGLVELLNQGKLQADLLNVDILVFRTILGHGHALRRLHVITDKALFLGRKDTE